MSKRLRAGEALRETVGTAFRTRQCGSERPRPTDRMRKSDDGGDGVGGMNIMACPARLIGIAILSAGAVAAGAGTAAGQDLAGSPPAEQIAKGGALYAGGCASCHGAELQGGSGPALRPLEALKQPEGAAASAADLARWIRLNMPVADPGSLSTAQAHDVTAFILARSGVGWGAEPLGAANSQKILFRKANR
jgi:mono/diheme cytochrome c family protein